MGPLIGSQTEQRQLPLLPPPFVFICFRDWAGGESGQQVQATFGRVLTA
jgi:hypothetical protein